MVKVTPRICYVPLSSPLTLSSQLWNVFVWKQQSPINHFSRLSSSGISVWMFDEVWTAGGCSGGVQWESVQLLLLFNSLKLFAWSLVRLMLLLKQTFFLNLFFLHRSLERLEHINTEYVWETRGAMISTDVSLCYFVTCIYAYFLEIMLS